MIHLMRTCIRCKAEKPDTEYWRNRRYKDGLDTRCRECARAIRRASDERHREDRRINSRTYYARRRQEALDAYGGKCACCGETEPAFLAIDHVNGDGKAHRATLPSVGRGGVIYRWLKAQGWPEGFQVLCHNCNHAKELRGGCPHQMRMLSASALRLLV